LFFLCFPFISCLSQTAIRQINRQRAERLKLPFHSDRRAFANFAFDNNFGIAQTIRKYNEARNITRLNHQCALSFSLYQLLNFPETSTDAPTAKANDFRAVCKSVALLKTVCIAASPNVSIFGFFICSTFLELHAKHFPVSLSPLKSQKESNSSQFDIRFACGRGAESSG
jgi:hypothetical protein